MIYLYLALPEKCVNNLLLPCLLVISSEEWSKVGDTERGNLGITVEDDGEFWWVSLVATEPPAEFISSFNINNAVSHSHPQDVIHRLVPVLHRRRCLPSHQHLADQCSQDVAWGRALRELDQKRRAAVEPLRWLFQPQADIPAEPTGTERSRRTLSSLILIHIYLSIYIYIYIHLLSSSFTVLVRCHKGGWWGPHLLATKRH